MKQTALLALAALLTLSWTGPAAGKEADVTRDEINALKAQVEALKQKVEQSATQASPAGEVPWYQKLEVGIGATGIVQGSMGVEDSLSQEGDVTDGSVSFDLELTLPVTEGGTFYALVEGGSGEGIDGEIPTISGINDDADDDPSLRITELWYEQECSSGLRFRIGKMDLSSDFDTNSIANSETDQFLSSGFVNNLAVEFPDDNGFGAMIWFSPGSLWDIGFGAADADADWENIFDDPFVMAEMDFKPSLGGMQGNYRIYGWYNGKDHQSLEDPRDTDEKNWGIGFSFDQQVLEPLALFARYGWQRSDVSQVSHTFSAGLQCSGQVFGRTEDHMALAYGVAILGEDWKDQAKAEGADPANEHHVEFYYSYKANDHLTISPDIQWIKNADGDRDNDDVVVAGLRAQLSF
jgi:carbohydrate-selective porin OprB